MRDLVKENFELVRKCYAEELTLEQYKANYKQFNENKEELALALKKFKVAQLKAILSNLGSWSDSRHKKQDLIDKVVSNFRSFFYVGRNVSYFPTEKTYEQAATELIKSTTSEYLQEFYDKRRKEKEEKERALENPETIAQFRVFIRERGEDALTIEQREKYESLVADNHLKAQEKKPVVKQVEVSTEDFSIHETKHSKTGADIFTVIMGRRVERDEFVSLRTKAKQLGGYYSRYTDKRANPPILAGFNFNSMEAAKAFIGGAEDAENMLKKVSEEKAKSKAESVTEKLKSQGEKLIEKADESLNQSRRENTHRQAAQASNARAEATRKKVLGQKLVSISNAIESGNIKYLKKLNNLTQLEQLEELLRRGYETRTTWEERQRGEERKPLADVLHVNYPFPTFGISIIQDVLLPHENDKGIVNDVKRVIRYCKHKDWEKNLVVFKSEEVINRLKKIAMSFKDGWERKRILTPIQNYERLQKMGITNVFILRSALRELIHLSANTGLSEEEKKQIKLKEMEQKFIGKKIDGFFPTPEKLVNDLLNIAKIKEGEKVLEPSAGLGHIASAIKDKHPDNDLTVVEINHSLSEVLKERGFNTINDDFLNHHEMYDVIIMNPPFEKHQDIKHVAHAYNLLNEGGRLVAVMAGNKNQTSREIVTKFVDLVNGNGYMLDNEENSFKSAFRSTSVNTVTVYLEKYK